jgi:hypothetical protein
MKVYSNAIRWFCNVEADGFEPVGEINLIMLAREAARRSDPEGMDLFWRFVTAFRDERRRLDDRGL